MQAASRGRDGEGPEFPPRGCGGLLLGMQLQWAPSLVSAYRLQQPLAATASTLAWWARRAPTPSPRKAPARVGCTIGCDDSWKVTLGFLSAGTFLASSRTTGSTAVCTAASHDTPNSEEDDEVRECCSCTWAASSPLEVLVAGH